MNKIKKSKNNKTRNNKTRNNKTRKYRDIKKKTRIQTGSGVIIINGEPENAFNEFIEESNVKLLTDQSSFGVIFEAKLNYEFKDKDDFIYKDSTSFKEDKIINKILIKIVALRRDTNNINYWEYGFNNQKYKFSNTISEFINEVQIQQDVYIKTLRYLEPICPAIIHIDIPIKRNLIRTLIKKTDDEQTKNILKKIEESVNIDFIGLIVMEIADGYKPLYDFIYNNNYNFDIKENYKCMAKLQLFKMAKYAGYLHNDFHADNILLNRNYEGIYDGIKGKVLLIDFGFSTSIYNNDKINYLNNYLSNNNYQEFFDYVYYNLKRPDGTKFTDRKDLYQWIIKPYNETKNNTEYIKFFQEKEIKINKIKQQQNNKYYPLDDNELQKYKYNLKIPDILNKINNVIDIQYKQEKDKKNFIANVLKDQQIKYEERKNKEQNDYEQDDLKKKQRINYELKNNNDNYYNNNKKNNYYEGGKSQL
jgi:hypothetical protein